MLVFKGALSHLLDQRGWRTFSVKEQIVSILSFAGYMVFVANIQLCPGDGKAVIDNL